MDNISTNQGIQDTDTTYIDEHYDYSSFLRRFFTYFIDSVLISLISSALFYPFINSQVYSTSLDGGINYTSSFNFTFSILALALTYGYYALMYQYRGATIGQLLLKIRVINETNQEPLDWGRTALREILGKVISSVFLLLGFFWFFRSEKAKTWHDIISESVVVNVDENGNIKYTDTPRQTKPYLTWLFPIGCCLIYIVIIAAAIALAATAFSFLDNTFRNLSPEDVVEQQVQDFVDQQLEQQLPDFNSQQLEQQLQDLDLQQLQDFDNQQLEQQLQDFGNQQLQNLQERNLEELERLQNSLE